MSLPEEEVVLTEVRVGRKERTYLHGDGSKAGFGMLGPHIEDMELLF